MVDAEWMGNLEKLLTDSSGDLSRALKVSSLIVLAAEELRSCVEQKALFFFGLSEDSIVKRTESEIPAELKGLVSKQQSKRLKAASLWFQSVGAFEEEDIELVHLAVELRNSVAHELHARLIKADLTFFAPEIPFSMVILASKVNRWWMENYEFDDEEFSEVDFDRSEQLSTEFVRHLILAAFPELQQRNGEG